MKRSLIFVGLVMLPFAASAVTISNCDQVERTVMIDNGGQVREAVLEVGRSVTTSGPMVNARTEDEQNFTRLKANDIYCVRKGHLSLQMRRPFNDNKF